MRHQPRWILLVYGPSGVFISADGPTGLVLPCRQIFKGPLLKKDVDKSISESVIARSLTSLEDVHHERGLLQMF